MRSIWKILGGNLRRQLVLATAGAYAAFTALCWWDLLHQHRDLLQDARAVHAGIFYVLGAFGLGLTIAGLLGTRLTRRLRAIREVSRGVRHGAQDLRVPGLGEDEVGELAVDFNEMLDELHHREQEIKRLNTDLERRVEARTREMEDALALNRKFIAAAPMGILVFAQDGRCVLANATAARCIGGTVEQLQAQNFRQIASWERSGLREPAEHVLATGESRRIDISMVTTFQREVVLDCALVRFETGGRLHLLLIFAEITERRQAEALRAQLSAIAESTSDLIASASLDGTIRYLNPTARRLFGLGAEVQPSTRSIRDFHPDASLKRVLEEGIPTAVREGSWTGETEFRAADGRAVPYSQVILSHRAPDGSVEFISTVARDISGPKRAEELMTARLQLFKAASETSVDGFMQTVLDEIEARTGSAIGFFHFLGADQETLTLQAWSTNTLGHQCTAEGKGQHYPISKAGVWVDCVRERRAVIHNDYPSLAHKQGLPKGHAQIVRELVVPVIRNNQIRAIIGVGNKATPYDQTDVDVVTLLGDFSWEIVERKRAEEALAVEERRLRLAAETAEIGIWEWDLDRNTVRWDAQMYRLYGRAPRGNRQISYREWADAVLPADLPEQERMLQETARTGGRSVREFRIRRAADDQVRHIHAAEIAVTDAAGRPVRVVGVNLDITRRKQNEAELQQSLSQLQATLQSTADGILVVSDSGRVSSHNQHFVDLWNLPAALLASADDAALLRQVSEQMKDPAAFAARVAELYAEPERDSFDVLELRDGRVIERYSRPQVVDGRPVGRVWSFREVTQQRQAVAAQQQLLAELSRSNTDLEQFAYVSSHDLKSPLRAIGSLTEWLQEDLEPALTAESRRHLGLLRQRVARMERLLDDLLAYARAGRVPADLVPVDCAGLVTEITELIDLPPGFQVRQEGGAVFTTAATPLRTVLSNLIANAVKHHDRPGGLIEVSVHTAGDWYEFVVADDGPGIPPEFHQRIFGMFQTLRPRDEKEGSGIGLALVQRIVTRYGGRVTVECRQPRGSSFRFTWPREIPPEALHLA